MTINRRTRLIGMLMIALAAFTELLVVLCYERGFLVRMTYLTPAVFAYAGMTLCSGRYHKRLELWLGVAFCAWFVLSRVLMGELYLEYSYPYLCNLCFAWILMLSFAYALQDDRQTGMQVFSWIYFIGFGLVAWLSLLFALQGRSIHLPYLATELGLREIDRRLTIGLHPNGSGVMMLISLMMGIWLLVKLRKRWLILPAAVLLAGLYAAIGLTVSRTVMLQCGCFVGGVAAVLLLRLLPWKTCRKLLAAAILALFLMLVVFNSFGWIANGAEVLNEQLSAHAEAVSDTAGLAEDESLVADRSFMYDLATLTGRTDIWRSILGMMKDHPSILFTGLLNSNLEGMLVKYTTASHAHNALLHTLCNTGLPGMLIALFFTLRAAICAIRLIFSQKAAFSDQVLAMMLLAWLLGSVTEASLFVETFTPCNIAFMLTLGYALEAERKLVR